MKVLGLVSGGKDSAYNMMQCVAHGHEIVALANLKPPTAAGKDELDSYMYQTVGHDAIHFYADCMELPLYRRDITGQPIAQESEYTLTHNDETEDLFFLLKEILEKHPDIKGVSVGAILSNYQRVRVEHVCERLGLTSLAYLWERNQKELLAEMVDAGVNAILIKVAAMGLKSSHLGKTLEQMYPELCSLNDKYDLHICGEGGEYETFTLDCPLFKKRIVLDETEVVIHSDDAFAPVGYLRLKKCHLEDKD
ncbi:protein E01A2.5 [Absidia repens]|uniref:Diphthine--ammonia ligase n=1 Tax=Absidia repens TaxID=90262 RepID=A0A1X2HYX0_9FUNG|nr:protein E01A2.5 [Absidia repens]